MSREHLNVQGLPAFSNSLSVVSQPSDIQLLIHFSAKSFSLIQMKLAWAKVCTKGDEGCSCFLLV